MEYAFILPSVPIYSFCFAPASQLSNVCLSENKHSVNVSDMQTIVNTSNKSECVSKTF